LAQQRRLIPRVDLQALMPLPSFAPLRTDRLTVRPVAPSDLLDLMAVNGDLHVTQFLPYRAWTGLGDAAVWLERMDRQAKSGSARQLVIEFNASTKAIGTILLFRHDEESARVELGYALARSYWRQGIASEALRPVLGRAFSSMAIRRVEAEVRPENSASNALLSKLGFACEGLLRERWVERGVARSVNIFGLLKADWLTAQASHREAS
jgi:[ribosomal protein S5]-alanine N-acetyltransferase